MIAFEVHKQGLKICTASVGKYGVLSATITFVAHRPQKLAAWKAEGCKGVRKRELELDVGGLTSPSSSKGLDTAEHLRWVTAPLKVGDEILIRVVDSTVFDEPTSRTPSRPEGVEEQEKEYVRQMAKKYGWTITESGSA